MHVHLLLLAAQLSGAASCSGPCHAADCSACAATWLQTLGTHNSYHVAPPPGIVDLYSGNVTGLLGAWQYSEPPLAAQLDAG